MSSDKNRVYQAVVLLPTQYSYKDHNKRLKRFVLANQDFHWIRTRHGFSFAQVPCLMTFFFRKDLVPRLDGKGWCHTYAMVVLIQFHWGSPPKNNEIYNNLGFTKKLPNWHAHAHAQIRY